MDQKKKNVFTLVGLLLVVVIIGILIWPNILNFIRKMDDAKNARIMQANNARIIRSMSDIAVMGSALSLYEITIGELPTSDQGLLALIENPGVEGWRKRFIQKDSFSDPWSNDYRYICPGSHGNDYDLFSIGPDRQEGTEDDIGNWDAEE